MATESVLHKESVLQEPDRLECKIFYHVRTDKTFWFMGDCLLVVAVYNLVVLAFLFCFCEWKVIA